MRCRCHAGCELELKTGVPVIEVKLFDSARVPSFVALEHLTTVHVCDDLRRLGHKIDDVEIVAEQASKAVAGLTRGLGGV